MMKSEITMPMISKKALARTMSSSLTTGKAIIDLFASNDIDINRETYMNVRAGTSPVAKKRSRSSPKTAALPTMLYTPSNNMTWLTGKRGTIRNPSP